MPELDGDFAVNYPAERSGARNRELHMPEVLLGRDKLDPHILLAVASPVNGDNPALRRLRCVVIHDRQRLSHKNTLFKRKQHPMAVYGLRIRLRAKLFARFCFSKDG
jgi:hypothetical protein